MMTGEVIDPLPDATAQERELLRALRGELTDDERQDFARRLAASPDLAERFERWSRAWNGVSDPADLRGTGLPADFAARVVEQTSGVSEDWYRAPAWVRSAAAAALVVGMACGIGWGRQLEPTPGSAPSLAGLESVAGDSSFEESPISLWEALATEGELRDEGDS